jgi:hypothetical protein
MSGIARFDPPKFTSDVIVIVGGYGSGKSEVSVNLARHLCLTTDSPVSLGDLDVINPYFRSREAAESLARLGVKSIVPPGAQAQADLPIVLPEIKGAIQSPVGTVIIDVGGDDAGATVLASLADAFVPGQYEMLMTVNAYRPFTSDADGTIKTMSEIETTGKLKFTGLISNSHMIEQTTPAEILHGIELVEQVSQRTGLPVSFVSGLTQVLARMDRRKIPHPVLEINRSLLKPWERNSQAGTS